MTSLNEVDQKLFIETLERQDKAKARKKIMTELLAEINQWNKDVDRGKSANYLEDCEPEEYKKFLLYTTKDITETIISDIKSEENYIFDLSIELERIKVRNFRADLEELEEVKMSVMVDAPNMGIEAENLIKSFRKTLREDHRTNDILFRYNNSIGIISIKNGYFSKGTSQEEALNILESKLPEQIKRI